MEQPGAACSIAKLHVGTSDECRCMQMTVVDACHWHLISSIVDRAPPPAASEGEGFGCCSLVSRR